MEIRRDSKTVVDRINGKARERATRGTIGDFQSHEANRRVEECDWAVHTFRENNKEAEAWADELCPAQGCALGLLVPWVSEAAVLLRK